MENCSSQRIARIIALIDELWSVIDLLFTFIIHFGGEHVNGIFYQLELQADLGLLHPNQVMGKRALMGLLFFLSLLVNVLWIFAGFILFKATDTIHCTASYRRRLQYCKIWLSISILLLTLHGLNMCIYITESFLQMGLALSAFLTRSVFMYFVRKFMRELELGPQISTTMVMTPICVQYEPRHGTGQETQALFNCTPSSSSPSRNSHHSRSNNPRMGKYSFANSNQQAQIQSNNNHHGSSTTSTRMSTPFDSERHGLLTDSEQDPNEEQVGSSQTIITLNPLSH